MKIVANIQPFVIPQTFQIINENSNAVEAEFSTTLDKMEEDITAQADRYGITDIYLHGDEGFLDKMQKEIMRYGMTKYNSGLEVHII